MCNTKVQEKYERWRAKLCGVLGILCALDLLYVISIVILMFKRSTGTLYDVLIMGVPADVLLFIGMGVMFSAIIVLGSINLIVRYVLMVFLAE